MKSRSSKGSVQCAKTESNMATCSPTKLEPTSSQEEMLSGVVTRARARRLSGMSALNSPMSSPATRKSALSNLPENVKSPMLKSPKTRSSKVRSTMNKINEPTSEKKNVKKINLNMHFIKEASSSDYFILKEEDTDSKDGSELNIKQSKTKPKHTLLGAEHNQRSDPCLAPEIKKSSMNTTGSDLMEDPDTVAHFGNSKECIKLDQDGDSKECIKLDQDDDNVVQTPKVENNANEAVEENKIHKKSALVTPDVAEKKPVKEKLSFPAGAPATPKKAVVEDKSGSEDDSDAESRKEIMRSAEKRIIRNISTSESESRNVSLKQVKMKTIVPDSTESESDSAPEEVTFDASRKSALDVRKNIEESIMRDKQKKKEKRKERLEIIRQRKEENLIRLKERKANLEDASCSSSEESVHELNAQFNTDRYRVITEKTGLAVDDAAEKKLDGVLANTTGKGIKRLPSDLLENLPDQLTKKKRKKSHLPTASKVESARGKMENTKLRGSKTKRDIDFIPISSSGSTQFGVVPLNKPQLKTVAQTAADFRNKMLYGSKINRVPVSTLIKNREKLNVYK